MILDRLPPFQIGGAETQALRLAKKLISLKVNVILLTPGRDKIKGYAEIDGIHVYRLHSFLNYFWDFLSILKKKTAVPQTVKIEFDDATERTNEVTTPIVFGVILRYLIFYLNSLFFLWRKRNTFDIIHVHSMEWPSFVAGWLCKRLKKKLIIKDATMNGINGLLRYPHGKQKLKLIKSQATFVAMSMAIHRNFVSMGVPENKIADIPNGIELSDEAKTNYATKNRKVIFVGNLSQQPAKGVDILLKAWKKIVAVIPDATLTIVGDGPLQQYQDYVNSKGIANSVHLLGKQTDTKKLLIEADIFVLPSRREGMPNALMEAMLLGLPCVATDISGSQDLITDRVNGLLVPPADIQKLAEAILFLMNRPKEAKEMGTKARERIYTLNGMDVVAKQYLALYSQMVQSGVVD
jgi:glycosyltransferase involved in cell wall biosynthesis